MSDSELDGSVVSADDKDETMIEKDSTAELKEEIRNLKLTVKALLEKVGPSSSLTEATQPSAMTTAASCSSSQVKGNIQASMPPMQQKLSINEHYLPPSLYPGADMPLASYMPSPSVHAGYMPVASVQTTNFLPPAQTSSYMTQSYTQTRNNARPPSQQPCTYLPTLLSTTISSSATTTTTPTSTMGATAAPFTSQNVFDHRSTRKLYDLPEFNGQPEQWPMFLVSYKETTQCYNYTRLENLFRLQKALKGEAKAKVEAFLIHPESVDQVMKTLEFHYGRPHVMIRSQISKVRAFPAISGRKISDIVNFSTMVANLTVFLENAGAAPHLNNPTLLDELVNKLPFTKREEWVKYSLNNLGPYPSVREFSIWLQEVATYVSFVTENDSIKNDQSNSKKGQVKTSLATTTVEQQQPDCLFCQQKHYLNQCSKFKNVSTAERWSFVKDNRLCFSCLHIGHNALKCSKRRRCGLSKCPKYHNRLLHEESNSNKNVNKSKQTETISEANTSITDKSDNDETPVATISENSLNKKTLFKYLPVEIRGPLGCVKIIAFIDEGSKISLLNEKVANQIGLHGPVSNLSLGWIKGKKSNEMSKRVNFEISSPIEGSRSFPMRNVRTTSNLKLEPQSLYLDKFKEKHSVLNNVSINDYINATPSLLIGLPHNRLVRPNGVINLDEGFSVHQTNLGSVLFGSNEEIIKATVCVVEVEVLDDLQRQISDYFTLESFGMKNIEPIISNEDKRAEEILENTSVKIGQQYETGLLWKKDNFESKESYARALKRLQGVEAKMKKDEDLAKWYIEKIDEYVLKNYARKLPPEEVSIENDRTWYLPHFVVTNINKGNKRRLVFDAAASIDGESFNSRLMKGPSKYQPRPLLAILFKFRQRQVGVCADIRDMFLRIKIREPDQTAQRFLWRKGDTNKTADVYVMQAMIFGSACSPCSAQYVKNMNAKPYEQSHPKAYKAIVECHYVDDYVDSFDSVDEAVAVTKDVVSIHEQAGFELRSFVSNSPEFGFAVSNRKYEDDVNLTNIFTNETATEKILGLLWSPADDIFCFVLKFAKVPEAVLHGNRKPTKREVLSLTMSIFDPIGFLANMVIRSKILLQELWKHDVEWTEPIPDEVYNKWYDWYKELQNVKFIRIPRCYGQGFSQSSSRVELHMFTDASEMAFAAVGYWRIWSENNVDIVFVAGKAKCAPIKLLSIPRLELQAAVLGVRLKEAIIHSHDISPERVVFWSDSKTVIKWVQSDCRVYKQFVSHRVAEVLEYSEVNQWRWVPGSQNPADDATRPQQFTKKSCASRWLIGSQFLRSNEMDWPKLPSENEDREFRDEIRSRFLHRITEIQPLILYDDKSRYFKFLRIRCWLMRAIKKFKSYIGKATDLNFKEYLTTKEMEEAEIFWCQIAQQEEFKEEYNSLKLERALSKKSPIYKLSPFLAADGLIRMAGRIYNADCITVQTKEPIIMPKKHLVTKLIVKQFHENMKHHNQESICAAIRTKYWVAHLRQLVRSVKKNCQVCKNLSAVPRPPLMGQLPEDRVKPYVRPFTYTGLDYLGPFRVAIGRRCEKRWVALFTCMTVRAIHLEIAKDLSTDAVILCILNFINRRGVPVRIRSDRGTNFVGASKEQFILNEIKVAEECTRRGIEWVFNAPANPSAGGAWERMVRSVKKVLTFTLKESTPQVETLNSLLIEAENLVNSRPLTHLPIEATDCEPLTPNHFLIGCPNIVQTPAGEHICLRKQWHILLRLKQTFWKRWVLEYLPDLTRRTKWYQPVKPLKVGDVVIICDDNEARGEWKRGVVLETFMAADGQVRSALVKTSVGKLRRPASKLAVLDVGSESPGSTHGRWDVVN